MGFATLHAIQRACQPPAGALKTISLIDPADLVDQPVWHLLPNIEDLVFNPGAGAYAFEQDQFSGRLVDRQVTGAAAGDVFEYSLQATFKHVRLEMEFLRAKLRNRRAHVAVTYQDDMTRVVPNMRLLIEGDSGDKSNPNRYSVSGSSRLLKPAPVVNGSIDVIGGPYEPSLPSGGVVLPVEVSTTATTYTYTIPSGKLLVAIYVKSTNAQTIAIGTTALGTELSGAWIPMSAGVGAMFGDNRIRTESSTPIYFSGLAGTNALELWLLG